MVDAELESFKTNIDLRAYAAGQGYELDRKGSWRGTSVMRHPLSDDKVIIKRGMDGHLRLLLGCAMIAITAPLSISCSFGKGSASALYGRN